LVERTINQALVSAVARLEKKGRRRDERRMEEETRRGKRRKSLEERRRLKAIFQAKIRPPALFFFDGH